MTMAPLVRYYRCSVRYTYFTIPVPERDQSFPSLDSIYSCVTSFYQKITHMMSNITHHNKTVVTLLRQYGTSTVIVVSVCRIQHRNYITIIAFVVVSHRLQSKKQKSKNKQ